MAAISSATALAHVTHRSNFLELEAHLIENTTTSTTSTLVKTVRVSKEIDFSDFPSQLWQDPDYMDDKGERNFISPFTFAGAIDASTINLFVENQGYLVYSNDGYRRYSRDIQLKEKSKVYVISSSTLQSIHKLDINKDLRFQLAFDPSFFRKYLEPYMHWGQAYVFKAMIHIKNIFSEFLKLPLNEAYHERAEFLEGFVRSRISFLLPDEDRLVLSQNKAKVEDIIEKYVWELPNMAKFLQGSVSLPNKILNIVNGYTRERIHRVKPIKGILCLPDIILRHFSSYLTWKENNRFQSTCKPILSLAGKIQAHLNVLQKSNFWEFMLEAIKLRKLEGSPEENVMCFFGYEYKKIIPMIKNIQNSKNFKNFQILCYQIQDLHFNIDSYYYFINDRITGLSPQDIKSYTKTPISLVPWEIVIKQLYPLFCDPNKTIFEAINSDIPRRYFSIAIAGNTSFEPHISSISVHGGTTIRRLYQLVEQALSNIPGFSFLPGTSFTIFKDRISNEPLQISSQTLRDYGICLANDECESFTYKL